MNCITLNVVKGLIAQAKAAGCDTNSGGWVIARCPKLHDVTLTNGAVTFSSRHNVEPNNENISTANTVPNLADDACAY